MIKKTIQIGLIAILLGGLVTAGLFGLNYFKNDRRFQTCLSATRQAHALLAAGKTADAFAILPADSLDETEEVLKNRIDELEKPDLLTIAYLRAVDLFEKQDYALARRAFMTEVDGSPVHDFLDGQTYYDQANEKLSQP